ncbi:hypothetical protein HYH02_006613 [Chlamydomonas schloesseri]|uniref:Flagellar associated protein n=1 Tax=Chlamydomonas schloesseri TaxID=2026947 RepID=A0A835T5E6_9CHLO|nr:hypothetical protein HYH02_006613 [Chlamydomonas schloesseri]|eukprot:KAG2439088.1 hypothetical protein HYH02_006613 [Chlamydomonas schloesseri]
MAPWPSSSSRKLRAGSSSSAHSIALQAADPEEKRERERAAAALEEQRRLAARAATLAAIESAALAAAAAAPGGAPQHQHQDQHGHAAVGQLLRLPSLRSISKRSILSDLRVPSSSGSSSSNTLPADVGGSSNGYRPGGGFGTPSATGSGGSGGVGMVMGSRSSPRASGTHQQGRPLGGDSALSLLLSSSGGGPAAEANDGAGGGTAASAGGFYPRLGVSSSKSFTGGRLLGDDDDGERNTGSAGASPSSSHHQHDHHLGSQLVSPAALAAAGAVLPALPQSDTALWTKSAAATDGGGKPGGDEAAYSGISSISRSSSGEAPAGSRSQRNQQQQQQQQQHPHGSSSSSSSSPRKNLLQEAQRHAAAKKLAERSAGVARLLALQDKDVERTTTKALANLYNSGAGPEVIFRDGNPLDRLLMIHQQHDLSDPDEDKHSDVLSKRKMTTVASFIRALEDEDDLSLVARARSYQQTRRSTTMLLRRAVAEASTANGHNHHLPAMHRSSLNLPLGSTWASFSARHAPWGPDADGHGGSGTDGCGGSDDTGGRSSRHAMVSTALTGGGGGGSSAPHAYVATAAAPGADRHAAMQGVAKKVVLLPVISALAGTTVDDAARRGDGGDGGGDSGGCGGGGGAIEAEVMMGCRSKSLRQVAAVSLLAEAAKLEHLPEVQPFAGSYGTAEQLAVKVHMKFQLAVDANPAGYCLPVARAEVAQYRRVAEEGRQALARSAADPAGPATEELLLRKVSNLRFCRPYFRAPGDSCLLMDVKRAEPPPPVEVVEVVKPKTPPESVFAPRKTTSDAKDMLDTEEVRERQLRRDWRRVVCKEQFRDMIQRVTPGVEPADESSAAAAAAAAAMTRALDACLAALLEFKDGVRSVFYSYGMHGTNVSDSCFAVGFNEWRAFLNDCGLLREEDADDDDKASVALMQSSDSSDSIFAAANFEADRRGLDGQVTLDRALMRFEWLEALLRLATLRHVQSGKELGSVAEAFTHMWSCEVLPAMGLAALHEPNAWRRGRLYPDERVNEMLIENKNTITALYDFARSKNQNKMVKLEDWVDLLLDCGMLGDDTGLSLRDAKLAFYRSAMVVVDEVAHWGRAVSMDRCDLMEALVRLAEEVAAPPREEVMAALRMAMDAEGGSGAERDELEAARVEKMLQENPWLHYYNMVQTSTELQQQLEARRARKRAAAGLTAITAAAAFNLVGAATSAATATASAAAAAAAAPAAGHSGGPPPAAPSGGNRGQRQQQQQQQQQTDPQQQQQQQQTDQQQQQATDKSPLWQYVEGFLDVFFGRLRARWECSSDEQLVLRLQAAD